MRFFYGVECAPFRHNAGHEDLLAQKPKTSQHGWYLVDAQSKVLGRLATQIAARLRGKHKPEYTPHVDTGDFIVVVNAAKIRVTGRKAYGKNYYRHTGYPGGIKETDFAKLHAQLPDARARARGEGHAAEGPARLRDAQETQDLRRRPHPHAAQQPKALEI